SQAISVAFIDFDGYYLEHAPQGSDELLKSAVQGELLPGCDDTTPESLKQFETWFLPKGCAYAPLRHPNLHLALPHLDQFRVILMTRDPRDCLTSLYYSVAYSHAEPENPKALEEFHETRDLARQMEIDRFVIENSQREWVPNFRNLCELLKENPHVRLVRYEDLVANFPAWLDEILDCWGLSLDRRSRRKIESLADFNVTAENVHSHKRQVQPGDHRRKLKMDTIEQLNELFGETLTTLGYSSDQFGSEAA
ncbi:MAG: sulfotransferase domain-containing protein, partial [Planctomycetes bacterium]|nr:sulfotransferase domain-containing protein [Planctomycetota bacterium]